MDSCIYDTLREWTSFLEKRTEKTKYMEGILNTQAFILHSASAQRWKKMLTCGVRGQK